MDRIRALWWTVVSIIRPPKEPPWTEQDRRRINAEYDDHIEQAIRHKERENDRWI
jgi:hypothetical protein